MDRLGYTAMSAASRSMMSLQVQANNLANVNTPGFRADLEAAESAAVAGYGYDSRHLAVVKDNGVDMRPGTAMTTGRPLDVAIQGDGLLAVEVDGGGEAYTRHGSLQVDADMRLTVNGRPVLGDNGPIMLPEYDSLSIGSDGVITVVPRGDFVIVEAGRIKLVDEPASNLVKRPDGLLATRNGEPAQNNDEVVLVSGHLESSNVSAIEQLVSTMSLNRLFEAQVKMMKAAEDLSTAGNRMIRGG